MKAYLDALEQHRPRRGRQRTPDSIKARLAAIEQQLGDASSLKRLQLVQERRDLEVELAAKSAGAVDLSALEGGFVLLREGVRRVEGHRVRDLARARRPRRRPASGAGITR